MLCYSCFCCLVAKFDSFVTPWTIACQTPLSMGFPRLKYCSGLPFPSPGDLLNPGTEPSSSSLEDRFFTTDTLSHVRLFATPWTAGFPVHHQPPKLAQTHVHRVSDAIQSSHTLLSPSLLPSISPRIRVFSNELTFHIRWPKYWSFSFSISPSNEY